MPVTSADFLFQGIPGLQGPPGPPGVPGCNGTDVRKYYILTMGSEIVLQEIIL